MKHCYKNEKDELQMRIYVKIMHLTKVEHLEDIKNKFSPNSKTANEGVKKWAED